MTYSEPARSAHRRNRSTVYNVRRWRALLGTVAVLLLGYIAFSRAGHLSNSNSRTHNGPGHVFNNTGRVLNKDRTDPPAVTWPQSGQAAFALVTAARPQARTSSRPRSPAWPR